MDCGFGRNDGGERRLRGALSEWQEARWWLLEGMLAMAGAVFLAALILFRIRRSRR